MGRGRARPSHISYKASGEGRGRTARGGMAGTVVLAESFRDTRVEKRFLTQMVALHLLLNKHGFDCRFEGRNGATRLTIERGGCAAVVGILNGERRFRDTDAIFSVNSLAGDGGVDYTTAVNCLSRVVRALRRWGMLGPDEITDEEVCHASDQGTIKCDACDERQRYASTVRFKQCALCRVSDKAAWIPRFRGFYCSVACQGAHWRAHKEEFHL
jgi:hypothetical protein